MNDVRYALSRERMRRLREGGVCDVERRHAPYRPLPAPREREGLFIVNCQVCLSFLFSRGTVWGYHCPLMFLSCVLFSSASEPVIYLGAPVSPDFFQVFHRYEV